MLVLFSKFCANGLCFLSPGWYLYYLVPCLPLLGKRYLIKDCCLWEEKGEHMLEAEVDASMHRITLACWDLANGLTCKGIVRTIRMLPFYVSTWFTSLRYFLLSYPIEFFTTTGCRCAGSSSTRWIFSGIYFSDLSVYHSDV